MHTEHGLIRTKYGYFTVKNKPTQAELEDYYAKKYYQEAKGSYEASYSKEEIMYFNNKIAERFFVLEKNLGKKKKRSLLDVGCGEGWSLQFFKKKGWDVLGLDYSSYGCEKFNPACAKNLIAGDVYTNLQTLIEKGKKFDVVWVDNVLEHVIDPEGLVGDLKKITAKGGILVIEVPNDFSVLQDYLLKKNHVDRKYWVAIPDHLSYFNKQGLENLMSSKGWKTISCLGDFPIDWNLLNPNTNYVSDKTKGKSCYRERIEIENLIHSQPMEKIVDFYAAMAEVGFGRGITGFFRAA